MKRLLGLAACLLCVVAVSSAQIPRTLSYQGVLTDSLGHPKTDGVYGVTFRIYTAPTGGSALWSEGKSLQVTQGLLSTVLGDLNPFPESLKFNQQYWLGLEISPDPELAPRIPLSSVAYSLRAAAADTAQYARQAPSPAFPDSVRIAGTIPDNSVTTQKIANGTIQTADVAPGFTAPYSDTAAYARVAPQGGFVDSARVAGSVPDNAITSVKIADGSILSSDVSASFRAPRADSADYVKNLPSTVDSARIAGTVPNFSITSVKILDGTILRGDVSPGFKAPYSDTSDFARQGIPVGLAGGDLTGSYPSPVVQRVQGRAYSAAAPSSGQVLKWNGSAWAPAIDSVGVAQWVNTGFDIYNANSGSVGIGTTTPPARLGVLSTTSDGSTAIWGISPALNGTGVFGQSDTGDVPYGVWGMSQYGYAGYFDGNVNVTGTLSKGGGSFKIDHPLDPENKYLYHSFVESPDMKNVYDGVATLDANGQAVVSLPDWFEALNRDFRYQLTSIGSFAPVYIAQKISGNRFTIGGGKPGMEISWQVTGIRKDPFANAHRIPVEEDKKPAERGKYLYPREYGKPASSGVNSERARKMGEAVRPGR